MVLPIKEVGGKVEVCSPGVPDSFLRVQLEQPFLKGELAILGGRQAAGTSGSKTGLGEQVVRSRQEGAQRAAAGRGGLERLLGKAKKEVLT